MVSTKLLNIFFILIIVVSGASVCALNLTSYSHFGNDAKKFTAASEMSSKDWNDPVELERVWQNSLLRIPIGEGEYLTLQVSDLAKMRFSNQKKSQL